MSSSVFEIERPEVMPRRDGGEDPLNPERKSHDPGAMADADVLSDYQPIDSKQKDGTPQGRMSTRHQGVASRNYAEMENQPAPYLSMSPAEKAGPLRKAKSMVPGGRKGRGKNGKNNRSGLGFADDEVQSNQEGQSHHSDLGNPYLQHPSTLPPGYVYPPHQHQFQVPMSMPPQPPIYHHHSMGYPGQMTM